MTRFHVIALLALPLAALALVSGHVLTGIAVLVALVVVMGFGVAFPQLRLFGPFICRGNATRRCVALTFDDGPDARSTPALLDLLRESRVAATFFCVGERVAAHRELAARIVREGHRLENHSYTHSNTTNFFTVGKLKNELTRAQTVIQEATGVAPQLFRPPMGLSNPRVFRAAHALGLKVVGWTVRSFDTRIASPERIVQRILRQLEPGAIILLHDGNIPAERLVLTVQSLLAKLREQDYAVVRLDKLLE